MAQRLCTWPEVTPVKENQEVKTQLLSPNLRQLGLIANRLHTGLRSITERAHDVYHDKVENMFLELDMNSAWQAAGYNSDDSETEDFLNRRHEAKCRFPYRDIYCLFEEKNDIEEVTVWRMLPEDRARNKCPNCGRHCGGRVYGDQNPALQSRYGNHQMMCRRCSGTVCMGCANDGQDPMQPICYPCQFSWQSTWYARVEGIVW